MDNGTKALLGIVSLVLGFYIGRTSFPASTSSRYVIPLGGQVRPVAQTPPTTQAPQPIPIAVSPPPAISAPTSSSSFPTPYPTPSSESPLLVAPPPSQNSPSTPATSPSIQAAPVQSNQAVTTGSNS